MRYSFHTRVNAGILRAIKGIDLLVGLMAILVVAELATDEVIDHMIVVVA